MVGRTSDNVGEINESDDVGEVGQTIDDTFVDIVDDWSWPERMQSQDAPIAPVIDLFASRPPRPVTPTTEV